MAGPVFLEGEKVELRTVEEGDLEFLRSGINHPEVRVFLGHKTPESLEDVREFFEETVCDEENVNLLICDEDEKIGIISLVPEEDRADKVGKLGLWLHPEYHGRGYGSEASRLIIDHGFNQLNYHKIYARAFDFNEASKRIWQKLGFTEEGVLREHVYTEGQHRDAHFYGILEGEWDE